MSRSVDQVLARYKEFEHRADRRYRDLVSTEAGRAARRRLQQHGPSVTKKLWRAGGVVAAALAAFIVVYAMFGAIGIDGFLLLLLGLAVAMGAVFFLPSRQEPEPTSESIQNAELAALPRRVERWLERRRSELPAAASRQVDELLLRLEVLAEQLEKVEQNAPVVSDARKLIGDELPRLVESYTGVPRSYRQPGSEAEVQLTEGLETVSGELQRLSEQLARGDLDRLAIEGRFLESKYRDPQQDAANER